jgi:hypothetical protein
MALLQLALIVGAKRELTLSADEVTIGQSGPASLEVMKEKVDTLEGPAYLKVGVATVSTVFMVGAEIAEPTSASSSLTMAWYLPDEEGPEKARVIDVSQVGLIPANMDLATPGPGQEWWYKLEARGPVEETLFFESGFQPPFKPSDITLYITDLRQLGLPSLILSQVMYGHKVPAYTEGEWGFTQIVSEGRLAV